jgi:hypothetical protein
MHDQQTRAILRLDRPQSDVLVWKLEIEGRQIGQGTPLSDNRRHGGQIANRRAL